MAFPWVYEEDFELGTLGNFNSETDTETRLDFPHYSTLAKVPGVLMPYRGAYCMRVNLANDGSPADAYVQEDDGFDISSNGTLHIRFMLYVSPNIVMADTDEFIILALQASGPTTEAVIAINYTTADGLRLGTGETAATVFLPLTTGVWHAVELHVELDNAGSNDGSLIMRLDGAAATTVSSLDQGAIIQARLGVIDQDAGTTTGTVLFDDVITDDARIYMPTFRFPLSPILTKSGHAFVGPGYVDSANLYSGAGTDNVLALYDTDFGDINDASKLKFELKNTANSAMVGSNKTEPIYFRRGCYVSLTGTNPRGQLDIRPMVYGSDGAIRNYGARRPGWNV